MSEKITSKQELLKKCVYEFYEANRGYGKNTKMTTLQLRKFQKVLYIALFTVLRTNLGIKELLEVGDRS